jgi:hypothetical protein
MTTVDYWSGYAISRSDPLECCHSDLDRSKQSLRVARLAQRHGFVAIAIAEDNSSFRYETRSTKLEIYR